MLKVSLLRGPAVSEPSGTLATTQRSVTATLARLADSNQLQWQPVLPASETGLRRHLETQACDVLHIVADFSFRAALYSSITLADAQGGPRSVNGMTLAKLVEQAAPKLGLILLTLPSPASMMMDQTVRLLVFGHASVVSFDDSLSEAGLAAGYRALASHATVGEAVAAMNAGQATPVARCHGNETLRPFAASPSAPPPPPVVPAPAVAPGGAAMSRPIADAMADPMAERLKGKRAAGRFDVFMCHNSADKPAVKRLAQRLKTEQGLLPWLDEWELPPGQPWQTLLEAQIESIGSAAVFFGAAGVGPWQEQEMRGFIDEFVRRKVPLIPVILDGAPALPKLPLFLRAMTWVDFRRTDPDAFARLVWGITQQRGEP